MLGEEARCERAAFLYCLIAIGLMVVSAALKPLSDGLYDTSKWAAKIFAPPESGDNATQSSSSRWGKQR